MFGWFFVLFCFVFLLFNLGERGRESRSRGGAEKEREREDLKQTLC